MDANVCRPFPTLRHRSLPQPRRHVSRLSFVGGEMDSEGYQEKRGCGIIIIVIVIIVVSIIVIGAL